MVWNPLTVAWPNGNTAVGSSRFALYDNPCQLFEYSDTFTAARAFHQATMELS